MGEPRVVCIMGSGETAPTMSSVHADLLRRAGVPPGLAVLLDTPFGFQENASEIVARAAAFFRSVGNADVATASLRSADAGALELETALTQLRQAAWIFAGPGSPSYALRQWRRTRVPALLAQRLREGGVVITLSSAAACTIGVVAVPVYEVYKVGEEPRWLEGLDLLGVAGLRCAVIPHYDNAEGGTHDTRYSYLGERRLRLLEEQLPAGALIVGVEEHTALILDLDADTATVRGRGALVVRRRGEEERVEAGETVSLDRLRGGTARGGVVTPTLTVAGARPPDRGREDLGNPLLEELAARRSDFDDARCRRDLDGMLRAVLEIDDLLVAWANDTLQSDARDRARGELRGMVVALGELARAGVRDPRDVIGPFVEIALRQRETARREGRFSDADTVRDQLAALGVEMRDGHEGTTWVLHDDAPAWR
ncbi:MAG TPA: hypothetical protein VI316_04630 [Candidatus Dormibacteraeota bacterium]